MGPKLMNCCRQEQMGTKEFGKMLKRIQVLKDGRVPAKEGKELENRWKKTRITRKEYKKPANKFEMEGLMAQKSLWNSAKEKIMNERGELPTEEGDAVREYQKPCMKKTSGAIGYGKM